MLAVAASPAGAALDSPPGCDFDNDGQGDFAVGAPGEAVGTDLNVGSITVAMGDGASDFDASIQYVQSSPGVAGAAEEDDLFGWVNECGDFNNDGFDELVVGIPGEDLTTSGTAKVNAGAVHIFAGSSDGPSVDGSDDYILHQASLGVRGAAEGADEFGRAVVVGNFNGDAYDDLAVNSFGEKVGSSESTGMVHVFYGGPDGLRGGPDGRVDNEQLIHQGTPGIPGANEKDDHFGVVLAAGDINDDGFDELVIGVPLEDIGSIEDAGAIVVIDGSASGLDTSSAEAINQSTAGIEGASEEGDVWGNALAVGDLDNDGHDDIVVGAPGEDVGNIADAGGIVVIPGSSSGPVPGDSVAINADSAGIEGAAEADDWMGHALAVQDFDNDGFEDVAIGIPYEDVTFSNGATFTNGGLVHVVYGSASGISTRDTLIFPPGPTNSTGALTRGRTLVAADTRDDGRSEILDGAYGATNGGQVAGDARVYRNSSGSTFSTIETIGQAGAETPGVAEIGDRFGHVGGSFGFEYRLV